ncbi:MAG TPA: PLP-dependent transferase [Opitutaceae bacterium]|jgi:cystathionine gamma-synthase|nr:PLP-dependent transferase [Opitutaceae bacterium]
MLPADIPLGSPIPASPHAVSVSLPTLAAVRGYEEKDPAIVRQMQLGYPRFFLHPFVAALARAVAGPFPGRTVWLVSSAGMAAQAAERLNGLRPGCAEAFADGGIHGLAHAESPDLAVQAKLFLQHVGGFLSSRQAEDELVRRGLRPAAHPEPLFAGDAAAEVRRHLRTALPEAGPEDIFLAPSGMNAIYAAYRAIGEAQAARGRTEWVQLGWLYLDSIALLRKFTPPGGYHHQADVSDLGALERLLRARAGRIAGLVTEVPTNPLIQTGDVAGLSALCAAHGVALVLDLSVSSPFNLNGLPHADLAVASLTKYTASAGDVIAGMVAVNPRRAGAAEWRGRLPRWLEPLYARDLARLAAQIGATPAVLARINAAAPRVAAFLSGHPGVAAVYWAEQPGSAEQYRRLLHPGGGPGGMISFVLKGDLAAFYDRLRLRKGPSFGMTTTLICPFLYLAHYDLVSTPAGRAELAANGLDPGLLRLCVGTEPAEEIIAALAAALPS